jgi:hypothetical protein
MVWYELVLVWSRPPRYKKSARGSPDPVTERCRPEHTLSSRASRVRLTPRSTQAARSAQANVSTCSPHILGDHPFSCQETGTQTVNAANTARAKSIQAARATAKGSPSLIIPDYSFLARVAHAQLKYAVPSPRLSTIMRAGSHLSPMVGPSFIGNSCISLRKMARPSWGAFFT